MSFTFNDALMITVEDNLDAFDIAKAFVGDDNDKHTLFCRVYKSFDIGAPKEKAELAKAKAESIFNRY